MTKTKHQAPAERPAPLVEAPQSVRWDKVASPLDRKAARAGGREGKPAPLLDFDNRQGTLI